MPMSGKCMIFKKFHAWRNARACIKFSSWIVKEDGKEKKSNIYIYIYIKENEIACGFMWWKVKEKENRKMRKKWTSGWEKIEKEKGKIKVLSLGN